MIGVQNEYVGVTAARTAFPVVCKNTKAVDYSYDTCFASSKNRRLGSTPDAIAYSADWTRPICPIEVKCLQWKDCVHPPSCFPITRSRSSFVQSRCRMALAQLHLHMFCCDAKYGIVSYVSKGHGCSCFLVTFDRDYFHCLLTNDSDMVAPPASDYRGFVYRRRVQESEWLRAPHALETVRGNVPRSVDRLTSRHLT